MLRSLPPEIYTSKNLTSNFYKGGLSLFDSTQAINIAGHLFITAINLYHKQIYPVPTIAYIIYISYSKQYSQYNTSNKPVSLAFRS